MSLVFWRTCALCLLVAAVAITTASTEYVYPSPACMAEQWRMSNCTAAHTADPEVDMCACMRAYVASLGLGQPCRVVLANMELDEDRRDMVTAIAATSATLACEPAVTLDLGA